jgi:hypothetical protein
MIHIMNAGTNRFSISTPLRNGIFQFLTADVTILITIQNIESLVCNLFQPDSKCLDQIFSSYGILVLYRK